MEDEIGFVIERGETTSTPVVGVLHERDLKVRVPRVRLATLAAI